MLSAAKDDQTEYKLRSMDASQDWERAAKSGEPMQGSLRMSALRGCSAWVLRMSAAHEISKGSGFGVVCHRCLGQL